MQCLGSNIYGLEFSDEIFAYAYSAQEETHPNTLVIDELQMVISSTALKLKPYYPEGPLLRKKNKNEVAIHIVKSGLPLLQYPLLNDLTLINPYEMKLSPDQSVRQVGALQIHFTTVKEQACLVMDVKRLGYTTANCYEIINTLLATKPQQFIEHFFENKYVRTHYFTAEFHH